jgi:alkanesulfonate monooxygenase SsuD/methylene tetrahydromethanopterin reductase-like flavin-dependent oxidoreductase (luciferase family)
VATCTSTLRLATLVLNNDFRHPAVLAKAAATLDLLSGGRLELGMSAGWQPRDYERSEHPVRPGPGLRRTAARIAASAEAPLRGRASHDGWPTLGGEGSGKARGDGVPGVALLAGVGDELGQPAVALGEQADQDRDGVAGLIRAAAAMCDQARTAASVMVRERRDCYALTGR